MMTIQPPVHVPVLLQEVLDNLVLPPAARILDLTLGLGGHAEALLARADADSRYLGVDRDAEARALARQRLGTDGRFSILACAYEDLWEESHFQAWQAAQAPDGFDAILADLGVSTLQLRTPERGFSFRDTGPLDMRMDQEQGLSARAWIAEQTDESLADAIYQYGEERASRPIARAILKALHEGHLDTTHDLARAVYTVMPREPAKHTMLDVERRCRRGVVDLEAACLPIVQGTLLRRLLSTPAPSRALPRRAAPCSRSRIL